MSKGYYTLTRVTDYGPYVVQLLLPVAGEVSAAALAPEKFSVYVERMDEKGEVLQLPKSWMALDDREPSRGYVPVRAAYPADETGRRQEKGGCIALDMAYGPQYPLSAAISAPAGLNVYVKLRYTVTQTAPIETSGGVLSGAVYDYPLGDRCPDAEGFRNGRTQGDLPLGFGYYIPQVTGGRRPLIVWLHGAGEGGVDPTVAYTGNKVTAFASERIQAMFGGAYILAPQTPTFWMNDGSGQYGGSGKSMYTHALRDCIVAFMDRNPGVDRDRVYLGGDSNGGFMTMRMLLDYPELFAAAFPVCEALLDETISDQALARITDKPIWFVHAKNDPVVDPKRTAEATYKRLLAAGAKNVHFTFWDKIEDIHGAFEPVDGKPYEYIGHFAWIPVYNDDCRLDYDGAPVTVQGREVGLLEWLSLQRKEA